MSIILNIKGLRVVFFVFLSLILLVKDSFSGHFLGYDMRLINIKDVNNNPTNNYKWQVRFYRDAYGIPIPSSLNFNFYKSDNHTSVGTFTMSKVNAQTFINYPENICAPIYAQDRVEVGIYESPSFNGLNFNNPSGYYATHSHNSRNIGIVNVQGNSGSYNALFYIKVPRLNIGSVTFGNSSPYFKELPYFGYTVGKEYTLDWGATDPDGDSIVYSMVKARDGGPTEPQFDDIEFAAGYGLNLNIADGNPDFRIDPNTGIVKFKPMLANKYLIAIRAEEYRNIAGVYTKIGEVRREMEIHTFILDENPPVLFDSLPNTMVYDTIDINQSSTKLLNFSATDNINDSLYLQIIPVLNANSNNIIDTNLIMARWIDILGNGYVGTEAVNKIFKGKGNIRALLEIKADSNSISSIPYTFKIVCRDNRCPENFTDTLTYNLFIKGEKCYNTIITSTTACDSFISSNGQTYFQSTSLIDTTKSTVGCDNININQVNILTTPTANFVDLNIYVIDTSRTYFYEVDTQGSNTYQWIVSGNGSIISGANSNMAEVKWNSDTSMEMIYCFVFNGSCFDSIWSPIVVSHFVGMKNLRQNNLNVYPNPVNNQLNLDIENSFNNAIINIYNTLGQCVLIDKLEQNSLDVSNLSNGFYHFQLHSNDVLYNGKFLIRR
jgi:Secretion system C-terminal sorting domain